MNARQKVKKLKKTLALYNSRTINPIINIQTRNLCKHRAVCYIHPEDIHLIGDPKFLDLVAGSLTREFIPVIRDNMRIEDRDMFEGKGKVAIFDMMCMKGGDT